jgi:hypothetical protein
MPTEVGRNRRHLTDLFSGPFPGHALVVGPPWSPSGLGDYIVSARPIHEWAPGYVRNYQLAIETSERFQDDAVPYANLTTNTGVFASAFGCRLHVYEGMSTNACALPCVETAAEADRLPEPGLDSPALQRFFALAHLLRRELGTEAPISVPDIQSPFDIAALVWKKESLFLAMLDSPDAVKGLVAKCHSLLVRFLREFQRQIGECNLCHCPYAWAPPSLGIWLSEDEAGSISVEMFEGFCLPSLVELSREFGGLFMHCCAAADHQYASFRKIPNLRGLNRVFQTPGPGPALQAFPGSTVFMQAWGSVDGYLKMLDMARPDARFLFNLPAEPYDEARRAFDRLRARCPRLG